MTHLIIHHNRGELELELLNEVNRLLERSFQTLEELNEQPDVFIISPLKGKKSIGIEQINEAKHNLKFTPFSANYQIYMIPEAAKLTVESQNALLKTLEEAPEYVRFFLLAASEKELLPTIVSRAFIRYLGGNEAVKQSDNLRPEILNMPFYQQVSTIEAMTSKAAEESGELDIFLDSLESYLRGMLRETFYQSNESNATTSIQNVSRALNLLLDVRAKIRANCSKRLCLEHLMLNCQGI